MNNRSLISYAFGNTWSLFTRNWEIIIGTFLLAYILPLVFFPLLVILLLSGFYDLGLMLVLLFVFVFLLMFFVVWLILRVYRIYLGIFRRNVSNLDPMTAQVKTVLSVILASLAFGVAQAPVFISAYFLSGFLAFIVVVTFSCLAIFISIKLMFFDIIILDRRLGSIEGLKTSWRLTKGNWWKIVLLIIMLSFVNFAGALALGIGILFTAPFTFFALKISAYQFLSNLEKERGAVSQEVPEYSIKRQLESELETQHPAQ